MCHLVVTVVSIHWASITFQHLPVRTEHNTSNVYFMHKQRVISQLHSTNKVCLHVYEQHTEH